MADYLRALSLLLDMGSEARLIIPMLPFVTVIEH